MQPSEPLPLSPPQNLPHLSAKGCFRALLEAKKSGVRYPVRFNGLFTDGKGDGWLMRR